jgi:hypothetical protein
MICRLKAVFDFYDSTLDDHQTIRNLTGHAEDCAASFKNSSSVGECMD